MAASLVFSGLLVAGHPAIAHEECQPRPACRSVKGRFHSSPARNCDSPVGFCTAGELTGQLRGNYAFVMRTLNTANEVQAPGVFFYTGGSVISLGAGRSAGTLLAVDTGTVDLEPTGSHAMAAILNITGGTGAHAKEHGHLVLRGTLDPESGEVNGDYQGEVCEP